MAESKVYKGTVLWFNPRRGFGFIKQSHDEKDIFLHWSNIEVEGFKTLPPNQEVTYQIGENDNGPQAVCVKPVGEVK